MNAEILDDVQPKGEREVESFMAVMRWWEGKRMYYTLAVAAAQVFCLISLWSEVKAFGLEEALIGSFVYLIAANCCYCAGWGIEMLVRYYLKGKSLRQTNWLILFILGTLFSVVYTVLVYAATLMVL